MTHAGRAAAGHPPHRADRGTHRDPSRGRSCLPDRRRLDLLPDLVVARLRPAGPSRSRGPAGGGAGRGRRIRQGRRPRLRPVEGPEARRAVVGDGDRARPAGLAHRVLGHEHDPPRSVVRHPHRRRRPDLPASRGRDRPERGGDRPDVRRDLAPLRAPADGRLEDGQVDRQHRHASASCLDAGVSARALRLALISVHYRAALNHSDESLAGVGGGDRAARRRGRGARPPTPRTGPTTPRCARPWPPRARHSGPPSTTTSTCRPRWRRLFDLVRDLNRRIERATLSTADARRGARAAARPRPRPRRSCPSDRRPGSRPRGGACSRHAGRPRGRPATSPRRTGCATSWPSLGVTVEDTRDGQRWRRTVAAGRG